MLTITYSREDETGKLVTTIKKITLEVAPQQ